MIKVMNYCQHMSNKHAEALRVFVISVKAYQDLPVATLTRLLHKSLLETGLSLNRDTHCGVNTRRDQLIYGGALIRFGNGVARTHQCELLRAFARE